MCKIGAMARPPFPRGPLRRRCLIIGLYLPSKRPANCPKRRPPRIGSTRDKFQAPCKSALAVAAVLAFGAEVANEIERARRATVKALFRAGDPAGKGKPARTAFVRANGGWFGAQQTAPDLPRDAVVLRKEDENCYVAALERNGFFGPDSWYMNAEANAAFAECAKANWRLTMPVLFMHGAYDYVCETIDSHLAEPMRTNCANLTEVTSSPCKFPRSGSLHSSP